MSSSPMTARFTDESSARPGAAAPPVPSTLEDTELSASFVSDLLLRTVYQQGSATGDSLAEDVSLPFAIVDDLLLTLQQRRLVEVRSTQGQGRRGYVYDLTTEGRGRAKELMEANAYVGSAPVPANQYWRWVDLQSLEHFRVTSQELRQGLQGLVLADDFLDVLGPGVNSGKSLFLYGPSGNGKTAIAEAIAEMFGGAIYIPRSVEVEGQIVQLYDPLFHERIEEDGSDEEERDWILDPPDFDQRFVKIERPAVIVGGELTLDQLELQHDPQTGLFRAPPQVKANGGVFVIDDFGRQVVRPRDLLNRWMYPLERRVDFLSLPTGQKLMVPFECLLVFATNLDPTDLVEEAFLRRIRYKLLVDDPTRSEFAEILRRICASRDVEFRAEAVDLIYEDYYDRRGVQPRSCHPRDIMRHLEDFAQYHGVETAMTDDLVRRACDTYFLDVTTSRGSGRDRSEE